MHPVAAKINVPCHHELIQIVDREPMQREVKESSRELIDLSHDPFSHNSLLMTEALAAAHNAPDTREDRIAELRAKIAAGEYEIDLLNLAEEIIRENPNLFSK